MLQLMTVMVGHVQHRYYIHDSLRYEYNLMHRYYMSSIISNIQSRVVTSVTKYVYVCIMWVQSFTSVVFQGAEMYSGQICTL